MSLPLVHTIDLKFQGIPGAIGAFLIPLASGGVLVECGPGSTLQALIEGLEEFNLSPHEITDVCLTHIHLDHAGSAGWWSRQGARIHVHHIGAPHLIQPERLLASAARIYGDMMTPLWGEFFHVPENKINYLNDGDEIQLDHLTIRAMDTPGHANHHMSFLLDGFCFSGDVGGVHLQGINAVRLPTVPPEFNPDKWCQSINKFERENISAFITTHYGIHSDARSHLGEIKKSLENLVSWMELHISSINSREAFRELYSNWIKNNLSDVNLTQEEVMAFELAISSQMSADGIFHYLTKKQSL